MRSAFSLTLALFACGEPQRERPAQSAPPVAPAAPGVAAPVVAAPSPLPAPRLETPPVVPILRVATYNILAGNYGVDGVVEALREIDADLVALQEVDRDTRRSGNVDQPRVLADALGMEVAFVHHRAYDGGHIGVALLSRLALANVRRVALPVAGLAALEADVTLAGDVLRVLVVHLHPTDPRDPAARRAKMDARRLSEARAVLDLATRSTGPTLVLGDFNARPSGPEYAAFSAVLRDACPDGAPTWPAVLPLVRIDYVWTSPELRSSGCPSFRPSASDHRPVVVDLAHSPG